MKKLTLVITVIILCIAIIMPAHAVMKKLAQTGLQFLKIDVSPRAAAMGGSYMMVGADATALFYNPAGIVYSENNIDFFASQTEWVAGISYTASSLITNMGNLGTFGVSVVYADYGDDIEGTIINQAKESGFDNTGSVDVGAYVVGVGYGRQLTNKFSIGGQIKWAAQKLGSSLQTTGDYTENKVSGLAYDFGTIFYPGYESLRIGMSIRNYSAQFKYEEEEFQLPLTFTIGVAMDLLDLNLLDFMGESENALLLSIDAVHPRDYTERLNIGAEFLFMDMFAVRAGYKYNYDEEGLTLGAGLNYTLSGLNVKIDYAYSPLSYFDTVNRFSIGIGL